MNEGAELPLPGVWIACGGRFYKRKDRVFAILDAARERLGLTFLIEGGEKNGADALARLWREERAFPGKTFEAEWNNVYRRGAIVVKRSNGTHYDAAAGPIRNQRMIDEGKPEGVIAFRGGLGTLDLVKRAEAAGIRVITIDWSRDE